MNYLNALLIIIIIIIIIISFIISFIILSLAYDHLLKHNSFQCYIALYI